MQKFEERQKFFMNSDISLIRSREERTLSLRKDKILKNVILKRSSEYKNKKRKFTPIIDIDKIDLPQDIKDHFENSEDKFAKIIQWISSTENESYEEYMNEFDPNRIAHSLNSKLRLYALEKLRLFSKDLHLSENEEFELDKNLFEILISILRDNENIYVKFEILEILDNFCCKSENVCRLFLDIDYISLIYNLLNSNDFMFVEKALILIGNIMVSLDEGFEYVITHFPLEIKLKELLLSGKFDEDQLVLSNILWVLLAIVKQSNEESLEEFADIVPKLADLLNVSFCNQDSECLFFLAHIAFKLSKNINMKIMLTSNNIPGYILTIIEDAEIMYDNLNNLITLIDLYIESEDNHFLDNLIEKRIIQIYEKKLKECINIPNNSSIKKTLIALLFAVSNIAAGTHFQVKKLISSEILQTILSISKITKCNDVLSEIVITFSNVLATLNREGNLNEEDFFKVLKYEPLRIFCDGIRSSNKEILINNCLKGIYNLIINFHKIPKEKLQENEIEINSVTPLINNFVFGKNEQLAENAKRLLSKYLEYKKYRKNFNAKFMDTEMMNLDN